jgi:hypothetical protein
VTRSRPYPSASREIHPSRTLRCVEQAPLCRPPEARRASPDSKSIHFAYAFVLPRLHSIVMVKHRPGCPRRAARARLCRRRLYLPATGGAAELVPLSAKEIYIKALPFFCRTRDGNDSKFFQPPLPVTGNISRRLPPRLHRAGKGRGYDSKSCGRIFLGNIFKDRLRGQKMTRYEYKRIGLPRKILYRGTTCGFTR